MSIFILVMVIVIASLGFYCRVEIARIIRGVRNNTIATWYDFLTFVWPVIPVSLIVVLAICFALWLITVTAMIMAGLYANAFWSAMVIIVVFPLWFISFIMPPFMSNVWVIGPMAKVARLVTTPIMVLAVLFLAIGLWSPAVKGSLDRLSGNKKQELANRVNKESIKTEPESGIFCIVSEKAALYDEDGKPVWSVPAGTKVLAVNLKKNRPNTSDEGMVKIMLSNKFGDFYGGNIVYVSSRKIKWS